MNHPKFVQIFATNGTLFGLSDEGEVYQLVTEITESTGLIYTQTKTQKWVPADSPEATGWRP